MKTNPQKLNVELLKDIHNAFGPSSNEAEIRMILQKELQALNCEISFDTTGSIIAVKKSSSIKPLKVLLMSHMDEIGFMISSINSNGSVSVSPIGGINDKNMYQQRFVLKNYNGTFEGISNLVFSSLEERSKKLSSSLTINDYVIDFGFKNLVEAQQKISIGDLLTFKANFDLQNDDYFISKAIDNRAGTFILLEAFKLLNKINLPFDLYFSASAQEELGTRGAKTTANLIKPDFAIVTDVSMALDNSNNAASAKIGGGVLIRPKDAGMIQKPIITKWFKELLIKNNLTNQYYISLGGTDAGAIHLSNEGCPVLQCCIVAREIHGPNSCASLNDLKTTIDCVQKVILELDATKIDNFKKEIF